MRGVEPLPTIRHKHRDMVNKIYARPYAAVAALTLLALSACSAPAPEPKPAPTPAPKPAPPTPLPPPAPKSWEDWAYTPGNWSYRRDEKGSIALYGQPGKEALFTARCDTAARRIYLSRPGFLEAGKTANMVIRATQGGAQFPLANTGSTPPYVAASLSPLDPALDRMAFSRGRFAIEVEGAPTPLVIPTWAEFSRVLEDCR